MENCTKHYGVRLCNLHKLHRIGPDHQPSSRPPTRQQAASQAAGRQPGSYVIYAPARAGAPAPRRSNVPVCACASAQVLRTRPRAMRVQERESLVGL